MLSEFRGRLVAGHTEQLLLDRMLGIFKGRKLLKACGHQRTDSTHVLAAIRVMNRLELVTEPLRAVLDELATLAPDWLRSIAPTDWQERYGRNATASVRNNRVFPKARRRVENMPRVLGATGLCCLSFWSDRQESRQKNRKKNNSRT